MLPPNRNVSEKSLTLECVQGLILVMWTLASLFGLADWQRRQVSARTRFGTMKRSEFSPELRVLSQAIGFIPKVQLNG